MSSLRARARLDSLGRDVSLAFRTLRRTAGFTFVTVASLGLGLSLTAATAAAVNAYLIRSLPYAAADRLYHVMYAPPGPWEPRGMSSLDWRSVDDVVEFPITAAGETFYLADREFSQSVRGLRVGRGFVDGLSVRAAFGRSLSESDFGSGAERVALIGHSLWRDRYGADPAIVGRILRADVEGGSGTTESLRVVGVLPAGFYFGRDSRDGVDLLVPLTTPARTYMVRLRAGVPPALAEARLTEAARKVASGLPADWTGVRLESAHGRYVARIRPVLLGVTIACGLVLLIVCANVAVLMLLRTLRRQKELAVRVALGCDRWRLARMLLVEAALVCAGAMTIAMALTGIALRTLAPMIEAQLGRPAPGGASSIGIDGTVLLIVGSAGLALALAISVLPLLAPWSRRLADALRRDWTIGSSSQAMRYVRSMLITLEVAGTLILLAGCGLMVRSVVGMLKTDLGFEPARVVRARIVLRGTDYADAAAYSRFYARFTERLAASINAPVVFTNWPPFFELPPQAVETPDRADRRVSVGAIGVGAGYFGTLGIRLRSGRDFTAADAAGGAPVAVISETLAHRLWSDGRAMGRQVRTVQPTPDGLRTGPWRTVVAVAADVRQTYADPELSDIYVPQSPTGRFGSFYMRTDTAPSRLLPAVRAVAAEIDPHAMVDPPRPVDSENRQLAGTRFLTMLLTGFTGIAAFLALLGIYGVTAYSVQQRERETAIRVALGAQAGAVVRMFLRESSAVLCAGLALGLLGAAAAVRVLETQLYAVRTFDLSTLAGTCVLLAAAGMAATWLPARRASRRDPLGALKKE